MKPGDPFCPVRVTATAHLRALFVFVLLPLVAIRVPGEDTTDLMIVEHLVGWGFRPTASRVVDTIVLHTSYDALGDEPYSLEGILHEYELYGVAAHYLIDRAGTVYRLVRDEDVAWHAGHSRMPDGRTGVNAFSIGIELMNTTTDHCTDAQYASLRHLISELKACHPIRHVVGHAQIAPGRKTDPWNFEWERLADVGAPSSGP